MSDTSHSSKYGTRAPSYPTVGYVCFVTAGVGKTIRYAYPLSSLYRTMEEIKLDLSHIMGALDQVQKTIILLPVKLLKLIELKESYWSHPTIHYTESDRTQLMTSALYSPTLFTLLVTPSTLVHSTEELKTPIVLKSSTLIHDLELFMNLSDYPVDETATHAALYSLDQPFIYNWETGEMIQQGLVIRPEMIH